VYLGENLDTEKIQASYDNGMLTVRIPVSEQQRARKIQVSAGKREQSAINVGGTET
jgi:HSP20 family protein